MDIHELLADDPQVLMSDSIDRLIEENKELKKVNAELLKKNQIRVEKIREMMNEL